MSVASLEPEQPDPASVRAMLREIERLTPDSADAYALAARLVDVGSGGIELARSFESVAVVVKAHGDVPLMHRLTDVCLDALPATDRLRTEGQLEPQILISGRVWHLLREHRLVAAAAVADEGTKLAERYRDLRTAARGKLCHALVFLRMAAEGTDYDRDYNLRTSKLLLMQASERFRQYSGHSSEEVGMCATISAEWSLAHYQLSRDRADLTTATAMVRIAESLLTSDNEPYHWLMVVRALISHASRKYNDGKVHVTRVIDSGCYPEVVARAHQVRAELSLGSREKVAAVDDLLVAEKMFGRMGNDHAAASCWWSVARIDSLRVTAVRLSQQDFDGLEDLTPDPRVRRLAVLAYQRESARRFGRRYPPDWPSLVDRVQYE